MLAEVSPQTATADPGSQRPFGKSPSGLLESMILFSLLQLWAAWNVGVHAEHIVMWDVVGSLPISNIE